MKEREKATKDKKWEVPKKIYKSSQWRNNYIYMLENK